MLFKAGIEFRSIGPLCIPISEKAYVFALVLGFGDIVSVSCIGGAIEELRILRVEIWQFERKMLGESKLVESHHMCERISSGENHQ